MRAIQHIVAATDFSSLANLAVSRAALIASQLKAELHLIHVVHPLDLYAGSELSFDFQMHYQQIQQQAMQTELETMATRLREQHNIIVHSCNRIGRAHTEVATYTTNMKASLIVCGAQGEGSMMVKLIGSTALRLIKIAPCPVLIAKNHDTAAYRQVVAAVDLSAGSEQVPALARAIAPTADIETLLIFDSNQEAHMYKAGMDEALLMEYREKSLHHAEAKLNELVKALDGKQVTTKIIAGYPPDAICNRAKSISADLIVIGRHNRKHLEEWLLGSVSKGVAYGAACDVLLNH